MIHMSWFTDYFRQTRANFGRLKVFVRGRFQGSLYSSDLGPVVSLTTSLRGQLVKCFTTLSPNTLNFFVEKMREAFALQNIGVFEISFEILTIR